MSKLLNEFKEIPIADFCQTGSGGTPSRSKASRYFSGSIPWVKSGELRETVITKTEECITADGLAESSAKLLPVNTLLVALYGATVGRIGVLGIEAATNQAVCHIIPDERRANRRYLYYALQSKVPDWLSQRVGGGQPNISQGIIKDTKIPLPPLSEQKRIADILDKADAIRRNRQMLTAQLIDLEKSLFEESFAPSVQGHAQWPMVYLDDVLFFQEGPGVRKWQFTDAGVKLLNVGNIVDGRLRLSNTERYLSEEEAFSKYQHFLVEAGDLVMATSGVTWGKTAWVKAEHLPLCMNTSTVRFRPLDEKRITKPYMHAFLKSRFFTRQVDKLVTGSAQPNFGPSHLKKVKIFIPDIESQLAYEQNLKYYSQVSNKHQRAIEDTNDLFNSLAQCAFKGEL